MVHEFDWFLPICVLEQNEGLALLPFESKGDFRIQPLFGAARATPMDKPIGIGSDDLHIAKAKVDNAALGRDPGRLTLPPTTQALDGSERREDFVRLCVDTD